MVGKCGVDEVARAMGRWEEGILEDSKKVHCNGAEMITYGERATTSSMRGIVPFSMILVVSRKEGGIWYTTSEVPSTTRSAILLPP